MLIKIVLVLEVNRGQMSNVCICVCVCNCLIASPARLMKGVKWEQNKWTLKMTGVLMGENRHETRHVNLLLQLKKCNTKVCKRRNKCVSIGGGICCQLVNGVCMCVCVCVYAGWVRERENECTIWPRMRFLPFVHGGCDVKWLSPRFHLCFIGSLVYTLMKEQLPHTHKLTHSVCSHWQRQKQEKSRICSAPIEAARTDRNHFRTWAGRRVRGSFSLFLSLTLPKIEDGGLSRTSRAFAFVNCNQTISETIDTCPTISTNVNISSHEHLLISFNFRAASSSSTSKSTEQLWRKMSQRVSLVIQLLLSLLILLVVTSTDAGRSSSSRSSKSSSSSSPSSPSKSSGWSSVKSSPSISGRPFSGEYHMATMS